MFLFGQIQHLFPDQYINGTSAQDTSQKRDEFHKKNRPQHYDNRNQRVFPVLFLYIHFVILHYYTMYI